MESGVGDGSSEGVQRAFCGENELVKGGRVARSVLNLYKVFVLEKGELIDHIQYLGMNFRFTFPQVVARKGSTDFQFLKKIAIH